MKGARAVLAGEIAPLEGARAFRASSPVWTARLENDPDVIAIIAVAEETEVLPLGDQRRDWQALALIDLQPEIDRAQAWAKEVLPPHLQGQTRP
jgi:hypothetical protein